MLGRKRGKEPKNISELRRMHEIFIDADVFPDTTFLISVYECGVDPSCEGRYYVSGHEIESETGFYMELYLDEVREAICMN